MSTEQSGESNALHVRGDLAIPRAELLARATRAGGPGGQHVNTSSSRIELLWNVTTTTVLSSGEIERVVRKLGKRIDSEGWLRVVSTGSRSQLRNRRLAEERLVELLRDALHVPKKRRPTRPTVASRERRLRSKQMQSRKKKDRRSDSDD